MACLKHICCCTQSCWFSFNFLISSLFALLLTEVLKVSGFQIDLLKNILNETSPSDIDNSYIEACMKERGRFITLRCVALLQVFNSDLIKFNEKCIKDFATMLGVFLFIDESN